MPGTPCRVLVVDDCEDLCLSMEDLLGLHGLQVATAASPRAGIRVALRFQPHAALIDMDFGRDRGFNGFHVCAWLKARMPSCRRIAHTGHDCDDNLIVMRQAGFQELLLKPASLERLLVAISRAARDVEPLAASSATRGTSNTTREAGELGKAYSPDG